MLQYAGPVVTGRKLNVHKTYVRSISSSVFGLGRHKYAWIMSEHAWNRMLECKKVTLALCEIEAYSELLQTYNIEHFEKIYIVLNYFCKTLQIVCSFHITYESQSESTLYSCLKVKEHLARSRRAMWSLSDCNWTQTHNHLVHIGTLKHLAKLTK